LASQQLFYGDVSLQISFLELLQQFNYDDALLLLFIQLLSLLLVYDDV
jgi:hypothetical protein